MNKIKEIYNSLKLYIPIFGIIYYLYTINIFNIGNGVKTLYYNFKLYIPITSFAYYIYFLKNGYNDSQKTITKILVSVVSFFMIAGVLGIILSFPLDRIMGFTWQYFAYFEWLGFILITYLLSQKVFRNEIHSLNYVTQAVSAGGWLYEIPVFVKQGNIGLHSHHIANIQVFSFFMLIFILCQHKFRPNKKVFASFILYEINIILGILNYRFFKDTILLQRIPTMILLISLLTGIPKQHSEICETSDKEDET